MHSGLFVHALEKPVHALEEPEARLVERIRFTWHIYNEGAHIQTWKKWRVLQRRETSFLVGALVRMLRRGSLSARKKCK